MPNCAGQRCIRRFRQILVSFWAMLGSVRARHSRLHFFISFATALSSSGKSQQFPTCRALPRRLFTWAMSSTTRTATAVELLRSCCKFLLLQAASEEPLRKALQTYSELGIVRWARRTGNQGEPQLSQPTLCFVRCNSI